MKLKNLVSATLLALSGICAFAQSPVVDITSADLSDKTGIAPAFFGPNAYPVPEMSDGVVPSRITLDVAGDVFKGFIVPGAKDMTYDFSLNLRIPLLKERVALGIWIVPQEWFSMDQSVMQARRITEDNGQRNVGGDVYVTFEMALAKESRNMPAIVLRSALKTAAGDGFWLARYYDCPGYYFDLTVAKSLVRKDDGFLRDFRLGASGGFLYWQSDNGRQNDAKQYGAFAKVATSAFTSFTQVSGYRGWENYGDRPLTLMTRLQFLQDKMVSPYIQYQHGFKDWPFDQYRFGVVIDLSPSYRGVAQRITKGIE